MPKMPFIGSNGRGFPCRKSRSSVEILNYVRTCRAITDRVTLHLKEPALAHVAFLFPMDEMLFPGKSFFRGRVPSSAKYSVLGNVYPDKY